MDKRNNNSNEKFIIHKSPKQMPQHKNIKSELLLDFNGLDDDITAWASPV